MRRGKRLFQKDFFSIVKILKNRVFKITKHEKNEEEIVLKKKEKTRTKRRRKTIQSGVIFLLLMEMNQTKKYIAEKSKKQ
jgi:hypothetical protein